MADHPGRIGAKQIIRRIGPVRSDDYQINAKFLRPDQHLFINIAPAYHMLDADRVSQMGCGKGVQIFLRLILTEFYNITMVQKYLTI